MSSMRGSGEASMVLEKVGRTYRQGENSLEVLRGVNFTLYPGEMVALVGPSGSGKSTLLHIAGLLDLPDRGEVFIGGKRCSKLNDAARTMLRRTAVGFVYQFHHLLPEFSAAENVALPQRIAGVSPQKALRDAIELLSRLGLKDPETSDNVFGELVALARNQGVAGLIATHNMDLAKRMDRAVTMEGGVLREIVPA